MFNIAIDGPTASGKSTIAKAIAKKLGFTHIDTGGMYRAVAYQIMESGVSLDDELACTEVARGARIVLQTDGSIIINDQDVSRLIRNDTISLAASKISQYGALRAILVKKQQEIASKKGFVMDGRDITSVVLPDAELKIYQTADATVRAQRRYQEMLERGANVDFDQILNDLETRDYQDIHRTESPLIKVEDAVSLDTTYLSTDEAVTMIMNIIESRDLQ